MFTINTEIKLHHTDAAGVLFFSHQFTLAHDAYQAFLEHIGLPISYFVGEASYFLPIVHAEADYTSSLQAGQKIRIKVAVSHIGNTSFRLRYELSDEQDRICGTVETVHVSMDRENRRKITLPHEVRDKLAAQLG